MSKQKKKNASSPILAYETPTVHPKNANQRSYVEAMRNSDIVFGVGPAGTGKTFLAAYEAATRLNDRKVDKIVVCRPVIEAGGEKLGYLPGNVAEKCDPYLRPIYDGFEYVWTPRTVLNYRTSGVIEISPLAYMRGRTFTNSFIICDEAQNATADQLLMLMTRLGEGSRMVITGDPDQRDRLTEGLERAREKLSSCPRVSFCGFDKDDVVRHRTVQEILTRW